MRFGWKDQVSVQLAWSALQQSFRPAVVVSLEAIAVGAILAWTFRINAIQSIDWSTLLIGFVLLVGFVASFMFVGYLVPPTILLSHDRIEVVRDHTHQEFTIDEIHGFEVDVNKNWYSFTVKYTRKLKQGSVSFNVAVRPDTIVKAEKLIKAIESIKGGRSSLL